MPFHEINLQVKQKIFCLTCKSYTTYYLYDTYECKLIL